jgi:hypothetical protein
VEKVNVLIIAPIEPIKDRPPYVALAPVPSPWTLQKHIMMAQLAQQKESEVKTRK